MSKYNRTISLGFIFFLIGVAISGIYSQNDSRDAENPCLWLSNARYAVEKASEFAVITANNNEKIDVTEIIENEAVEFVGETSDRAQWILRLQNSTARQPRLVQLLKASFSDEDFNTALPDCFVSTWGLPDFSSKSLNDILDEQGIIENWHGTYRGQGVRIGIIDVRYDGFSEFRATPEGGDLDITIISDQNALTEERAEASGTESAHGTKVLRIMAAVAPDATYVVARAVNSQEFTEAVDELMASNVNIIVYAAYIITDSPATYHTKVREAVANNILWINAAGNIGAGYYRDTYNPDTEVNATLYHTFDDPTQGPKPSLMVPITSTTRVNVTVVWPREAVLNEDTGKIDQMNSLYLRVTGTYKTDTDPFMIANPDRNTTESPITNNFPEQGVRSVTIPPTDLLKFANGEIDVIALPIFGQLLLRNGDGQPDNEIYIALTAPNGAYQAQPGTPFELFIEGALPREYDPSILNSLDPVVLVPGDLPEVLTVGAYDFTTSRMAWFSSRSNSFQYAQDGVIKPEITTYGNIRLSDAEGDIFTGTSAATPIIAGVSALIASRDPDNFDPQAIRDILIRYSIACLEDGAVGTRIGHLQLPTPDDLDNANTIYCGTYQWEDDLSSQWIVDPNFEPARIEILSPVDDTVLKDTVSISGIAVGSDYNAYTLEISPVTDGIPLAWQIVPNFAQQTAEGETYPVDLCADSARFGKQPTASVTHLFNSLTSELSDGSYVIRMRLCQNGRTAIEDSVRVILQNETDPFVQLTTILPDEVKGEIELQGIATGLGFQQYVIQVANNNTPDDWHTIVPRELPLPENQCSQSPQTAGRGSTPIRETSYLATFNSATANTPDGVYNLRLTVCVNNMPAAVEAYNIIINNQPPPFISFIQPLDGNEISSATDINFTVGGDDFSRYILRFVSDDKIISLVPATDDALPIEELCSLTASDESDGTNQADTDRRFIPTTEDNGEYQLEAYVCANQMPASTANPIDVIINVPEVIVPLAEFDRQLSTVSGEGVLTGIVQHPNLKHYTVEVTTDDSANTSDVTWDLIFPQTKGDETPEDLCSIEVEEPLPVALDGILARFDSTHYPDGNYVARLSICTNVEDVVIPEPAYLEFQIENPEFVDTNIIWPDEGQPVFSDFTIIGTVQSEKLQQYTLEITSEGEGAWQTIVGPIVDPDNERPNDLCIIAPDPKAPFGLNQVDSEAITPPISTLDVYPNGNYTLRLRLCESDVTVRESLVNIEIQNRVRPTLQIESPEGNIITSVKDGILPIIGTANGDDVVGYTVEIAEDIPNPQWRLRYPLVLAGRRVADEDPCTFADFPNNLPRVTNGRLTELDISDLPGNQYTVRIRLCIETENNERQTFVSYIRTIEVTNSEFIVEFESRAVSSNLADRIDLVGTIIAPDFNQYFIEMIREPVNETAENVEWLTLVGPAELASKSTLEEKCALTSSPGTLGSYQVDEETVGVLQPGAFTSGEYRARVIVCRGENPPYMRELRGFINVPPVGLSSLEATVIAFPSADVRQGPGEQYIRIDQLDNGITAVLLGRSADSQWVNISPGESGRSGWILTANVVVHEGQFPVEDLAEIPAPSLQILDQINFLVFASDNTGQWQIYSTDVNGKNIVQLTNQGNNELVDVSPSGQLLVFSSDRDGNQEIYVMDRNGNNQRNLTNNSANDYRPSWSPDGERILFESDRAGVRGLYALTIATGQITNLALGGGDLCCVDWSSNGEQIIFSAQNEDGYDVYMANLDGTGTLNLTNNSGKDINAAWQPNRFTIIFQSDRSGTWQIYSIQTDGSHLRQLTSNQGENTEPAWTPDGGRILFSSSRNGTFDLFIMNADGSNQQALIEEQNTETGGNAD